MGFGIEFDNGFLGLSLIMVLVLSLIMSFGIEFDIGFLVLSLIMGFWY